jgi:transposase|tara:strand:+ start:72 stop:455 length:384 start_codon:yes stop_codon:yes gene_type:complete
MARPTKYKAAMCDVVIELMREGASQDEVIGHLDISRETFYRWKEENKEFSDSIKRGKSLSLTWWERQGRLSLKDREFNYTGWYMNMKNRFKWADKQEVKNEGITTVIVKSKIPHYPGEQDEPGYDES